LYHPGSPFTNVSYRKSQIAIEYAHRFKDQHSQVFWVHAANNARFDQAYQEIAKKLRLPGWENPEIDTRRLVYEWLSDEDHGRWLMILDNADDTEMYLPAAASDTPSDGSKAISGFASYIPRSSKGSVLITTRNRNLGKDLANVDTPIEIPPFEPQEADVLLKSKLPDDGWNAADAGTLLETLGYIPLAITQAAAFVGHYDMSLEDYLAAINKNDSNLKNYLSEELEDDRRERGNPNSVFRTWKLSFDQIRKQKPRAAEMLSLMAVLDRQSVPEMLLRRDDEQDIEFVTALGTLKAFSLITKGKKGAVFGMHRLVQLSTQKWLELQHVLLEWQERALDVVYKYCPSGVEYETWIAWEAFNPHVQVVLEYAFRTESCLLRRANILDNAGCYDSTQGRQEAAYQKTKEALAIRERLLEINHPAVLVSTSNLAIVLQHQGKYEAAEGMNRQALDGTEKTLGRQHLNTLTIMNNLAIVLREQGKYEAAEDMNRQALDGFKKTLGKEHPNTLTSVGNLAILLKSQGKYEAAEEMSRQALRGFEKTLGKEHPDTLTSVGNLAALLGSQGKYEAAEKMNRQALDRYEKALGKEHPDTLRVVGNLALALACQGKYEDASLLFKRACAGLEKALGSCHPTTRLYSESYSTLLDEI